MNIRKIALILGLSLCLSNTFVFAEEEAPQNNTQTPNITEEQAEKEEITDKETPNNQNEIKVKPNGNNCIHCNDNKDPVEALKNKKTQIEESIKNGSIPKQDGEQKLKQINSQIKELEDFNKLDIKEKKKVLINDCKKSITEKIKAGKLDKKKGDQLIKEFTEKINAWDGNGYPNFKEECNTKSTQ